MSEYNYNFWDFKAPPPVPVDNFTVLNHGSRPVQVEPGKESAQWRIHIFPETEENIYCMVSWDIGESGDVGTSFAWSVMEDIRTRDSVLDHTCTDVTIEPGEEHFRRLERGDWAPLWDLTMKYYAGEGVQISPELREELRRYFEQWLPKAKEALRFFLKRYFHPPAPRRGPRELIEGIGSLRL